MSIWHFAYVCVFVLNWTENSDWMILTIKEHWVDHCYCGLSVCAYIFFLSSSSFSIHSHAIRNTLNHLSLGQSKVSKFNVVVLNSMNKRRINILVWRENVWLLIDPYTQCIRKRCARSVIEFNIYTIFIHFYYYTVSHGGFFLCVFFF